MLELSIAEPFPAISTATRRGDLAAAVAELRELICEFCGGAMRDTVADATTPPSGSKRVSRETLGILIGFVGVAIFAGTLPFTRIAVETLDPWFGEEALASSFI